MMPAAAPRSLAILLLRFAIWIAPHDALDWGHAMLSELHQVEGNWSALLWSLGGAGVLAKHAVLALILPGGQRHTVASAKELFAKETPVRKSMLYVTAGCVLASLLFFLAPVFRQAFSVSLAQWYEIFHVSEQFTGEHVVPSLDALAKKAEANSDAEAIAFVALRYPNSSESVRLAKKAVQLNPRLTWVLAAVGVRWPGNPEIKAWIPELRQLDPQNALPHFMEAEELDIAGDSTGSAVIHATEKSAAWQSAMEAAFQSPKLDTYADRADELDRDVLVRYHIQDPFVAVNEDGYGLPSYALWDSARYAQSLLDLGKGLEANGDTTGAAQKYVEVARFGLVMEPGRYYFFLGRDTAKASRRLAALSERKGDTAQASFYTSLVGQIEQTQELQLKLLRSRYRGDDQSQWNAFIARTSGFALLFCALFFLTCVAGVIVRSKSLKLSSLVASSLTFGVALASAVGALLSSAMLYVTYRPYSQILEKYALSGDTGQIPALTQYLELMNQPLGARSYIGASEVAFKFWCVVAVLCAIAVLVAVMRHFQTGAKAPVAA